MNDALTSARWRPNLWTAEMVLAGLRTADCMNKTAEERRLRRWDYEWTGASSIERNDRPKRRLPPVPAVGRDHRGRRYSGGVCTDGCQMHRSGEYDPNQEWKEAVRVAAQPLIGIVDDHESSREGISSFLRSAGYRTVAFESVEAFLEIVRNSVESSDSRHS